jgi:hypothetical protein
LKRVYSLEEFEYMVEKFQEIIQSYLDMWFEEYVETPPVDLDPRSFGVFEENLPEQAQIDESVEG